MHLSMKKIKKITGLILIMALSLNILVPVTLAQTAPETACASKKPDYEAMQRAWTAEPVKNFQAYKRHFEEARDTHHTYMECVFSFAENLILQSGANRQRGTSEANTPNTGLIDWMSPDQACLKPEELKELISKTDASQMLGPILEAHTDYTNLLNAIGDSFGSSGKVIDEAGRQLTGAEGLMALSEQLGTARRQRELEIISSLVAIDLAFTSLRELRLSFVMHVHLQCTLQALEKYRKALAKLRKVITPLPDQLRDASITK
jgi:hypothetical protein